MKTTGKLVNYFKSIKPFPLSIVVDDDGLGGGVVDRLAEQELPVSKLNGGGSASDSQFANRRAENYWNLREAFRRNEVQIKSTYGDGDGLKAQLASIRYDYKSNGQIIMQSKADMRKRGVRSPDRADCMMMGKLVFNNAPIKAVGRTTFGHDVEVRGAVHLWQVTWDWPLNIGAKTYPLSIPVGR